MKVRLKKPSKQHDDLTYGNVYRVIGIEADDFRLMNDDGRPYLYSPKLFVVIDKTVPETWRMKKESDGTIYAYPPELDGPGFFEDWFDYKPSAMTTLELHLQRERDAERPKSKRRKSA